MNYLVTGGAGFVGSHLVDLLIEQGHHVTIWDNLSTGLRANLNPQATLLLAEVQDAPPFDADVIFHLAAESRIQPSFTDPLLAHNTNVTGTVHVLDTARRTGAKVVYAGSSTFYGGVYLNPYAFTKWVGEEYCRLYSEVYNVKTAVARFFNVYGPRQLDEGAYATVIGIFERQKKENLPLTVTGDGSQRRDFTHVRDIVTGLKLLADVDVSEPVNLGSGRNHSILEVANLFQPTSIDFIEARPGEAEETLADITLAQSLGWQPQHRLEDYIQMFLDNLPPATTAAIHRFKHTREDHP